VPGELLGQIADRYSVSKGSLIRWNKLDEAHPAYRAGQKLRVYTQLPASARSKVSCTVRAGDSWAKIATRYGVPQHDLQYRWNHGDRYLRAGQELVVWVEPRAAGEDSDEPGAKLPIVEVPGVAQSVGTANHGHLVNGVQLPENYALYTIRNAEHSFGSSHAIETLQRGVAAFREQTGFTRQVLIADMSTRDGGRFGPHHSHRSGRDVDIGLPLRAGASGERSENLKNIDWPATWHLIHALVETGQVRYIFLSRSRQIPLYHAAQADGASSSELTRLLQFPRHSRTAIVRHAHGHTSHMHVRFNCGPQETACADE
jgi:LysM repeat protein